MAVPANGGTLVLRVYYSAKMTIEGSVQKISFWGSFYEVEVLVEDVKIVARMMKSDWRIGKIIFVNCK